jgi:hypothetical protein
MNSTVCTCGAVKAERARVCFRCLANEPIVGYAYVSMAIGEPGPRYYAHRSDGSIRRFARYDAACRWTQELANTTGAN